MTLKIKDKIILKAEESDFENQEHRRDCVNKTVTIKKIFYDDYNNIDTFFVEENKYEWTLENIVYKQETIEEAAERINYFVLNGRTPFNNGFKEGAKWQQQNSYSEEEVETIAKDAYAMGRRNVLISAFKYWFKQFKKK